MSNRSAVAESHRMIHVLFLGTESGLTLNKIEEPMILNAKRERKDVMGYHGMYEREITRQKITFIEVY